MGVCVVWEKFSFIIYFLLLTVLQLPLHLSSPFSFHFLLPLPLDSHVSRKALLMASTGLQTGPHPDTVALFLPFFSLLLYSCLTQTRTMWAPTSPISSLSEGPPSAPPLPIPNLASLPCPSQGHFICVLCQDGFSSLAHLPHPYPQASA